VSAIAENFIKRLHKSKGYAQAKLLISVLYSVNQWIQSLPKKQLKLNQSVKYL